MRKWIFISCLAMAACADKEPVKIEEPEDVLARPSVSDTDRVSPDIFPGWTDSVIQDYLTRNSNPSLQITEKVVETKKSKKKVVQSSHQKNGVFYMLEKHDRGGRNFIAVRLAVDNPERLETLTWIYLDAKSHQVYEWDAVSDSIFPWEPKKKLK